MKTLMYDVGDGRVFMGPQLMDVPEAVKRQAIDQRGITMVINLWHTRDPQIAALVEDYRHVYIPDGKLNDQALQQFDALARHGARHLDAGGTLLTQCYQGRNRSGLVAGMAMHHWLGISGVEAVERVRAGRGKSALNNRHWAALLVSLPAYNTSTRSDASSLGKRVPS